MKFPMLLLQPIVSVLEAVDADEADAIPAHLRTITQCLHNMEKRISRMHGERASSSTSPMVLVL